MKSASSLPSSLRLPFAILGLASCPATAANLMTMTFDNSGANINETAGWNGTAAPGGVLATGLTISSGMAIYGDFTSQNAPDAFHVDNWHTDNSADTRVGMTVGVLSGYTFSLGGGSETFATRLHEHPTNAPDIFNAVELIINGVSIGSQTYVPAGGVQTLTWNIGTVPSLNNLTSATFDLKFTGINNPGNDNHGPEWALAHGSFVSFTGTVVPEASHALLAALGMGLALVRRRR